jgi:hypothetical protein
MLIFVKFLFISHKSLWQYLGQGKLAGFGDDTISKETLNNHSGHRVTYGQGHQDKDPDVLSPSLRPLCFPRWPPHLTVFLFIRHGPLSSWGLANTPDTGSCTPFLSSGPHRYQPHLDPNIWRSRLQGRGREVQMSQKTFHFHPKGLTQCQGVGRRIIKYARDRPLARVVLNSLFKSTAFWLPGSLPLSTGAASPLLRTPHNQGATASEPFSDYLTSEDLMRAMDPPLKMHADLCPHRPFITSGPSGAASDFSGWHAQVGASQASHSLEWASVALSACTPLPQWDLLSSSLGGDSGPLSSPLLLRTQWEEKGSDFQSHTMSQWISHD